MRRILFYDAYAREKVTGGSSIGLQRLLKNRKDKDLKYFFLVNQLNEKYYEDNIRGLGIDSFNVKFPKALFSYDKKYERGRIKQIFLFLFIIIPLSIKLAYLLKKSQIDKVICNEVRAALTIGIGVRLSSIPLITFVRSDYLIGDLTTWVAFKISSALICVSEGLRGLINIRFQKKIIVISDGIEYREVSLEKRQEEINIINVANIVPIKGQMVLLQAINELVTKYENIKCCMLGGIIDKSYFNALENYIEKNNLGTHVIFTGFVENVGEYLSKSSIYVQPSFYEGLPLAIIEAFIYGLPVISSDLPGIASIVKNNVTGLTFKKGDYRDLTGKIVTLIENSKLREYLGDNGKVLVMDKYNIKNVVREFEEYISK